MLREVLESGVQDAAGCSVVWFDNWGNGKETDSSIYLLRTGV